MNEYIIVNKTAIQKRIEELEFWSQHNCEVGEYDSEGETIEELQKLLSQSTPLIPEIEKAFDTGKWGAIQHLKDLPCSPRKFQDHLGQFIAEAINEKLEREK